jgi:glycosyltransferase involved in cell wall biosynthesis
MKILFLDQSGKLGGAELSLTDVASAYRENCLVGLFADGAFSDLLEQKQIPHKVLTKDAIKVKKDSGLGAILASSFSLVPLISTVTTLARQYDLIYANTQKALAVGALASFFSGKPLVYHLRDILSEEHFSKLNRAIAILLANRFSSLVIANSEATKAAFIEAGGREELVKVVYNGFDPQKHEVSPEIIAKTRESLGINDNGKEKFIIGHFSRLSPWKGQHILLEALADCPPQVMALFVGDALFGENEYVDSLQQQVKSLGLEERVKFLGFRSDVAELMSACDGIAHTSTSPEPFGRVIIEAMLCGKPVIGAAAGGVIELIETGETGWLCPPQDPQQLAAIITDLYHNPDQAKIVAQQGQDFAKKCFSLESMNQNIKAVLEECL